MSEPSVEVLREIARYRGVELTEEQLEKAAASYAAFWPKLQRLRAVALQYVPPTITPSDAIAWIERGGKQVD